MPRMVFQMGKNRFAIVRSAYFDASWYRDNQKLHFNSKLFAAVHYLVVGFHKGLNPNPLFDSEWYRYQCTALGIKIPGCTISHYVKFGWMKGLDPHPLFSTSWYLRSYEDVSSAELDPLLHYLAYGIEEDRCVSGWFIASEAVDLHQGVSNRKEAVELCFSCEQLGHFAGRRMMRAPLDSI